MWNVCFKTKKMKTITMKMYIIDLQKFMFKTKDGKKKYISCIVYPQKS